MVGIHVRFDLPPEEFLAHLTEAAYFVSLKQGTSRPFTDLKFGLQEALREVIRRDMFVTDVCGVYGVCQEAVRLEPWTSEAEKAFEEG